MIVQHTCAVLSFWHHEIRTKILFFKVHSVMQQVMPWNAKFGGKCKYLIMTSDFVMASRNANK